MKRRTFWLARLMSGSILSSRRPIAYPRAVLILDHLNKLLKHPRTTRMPSLIVYGDSGMGKSMLVDRFKADCAMGCAAGSASNAKKLLVVELSGRPNERRLFSQILAAVDAPQSPRASIVDMEKGAINTLRDIGIQILVLDDIYNKLAGSWREQRIVLNTLRFLSNELKLSLVCFGIMEARDAINGDVQLARRFDAVTLPRWTAGKEFEQLVLAIVRNLPLREPSVLTVRASAAFSNLAAVSALAFSECSTIWRSRRLKQEWNASPTIRSRNISRSQRTRWHSNEPRGRR